MQAFRREFQQIQPTVHGLWRVVGLMSGTSADGVDAAILETDGEAACQRRGFDFFPYDNALQTRLIHAAANPSHAENACALESDVTQAHGEAVTRLLDQAGIPPSSVAMVGFHGHTIWHRPDQGSTSQLGNAAQLAEVVGIPVVSDFRRADVAAGGQGAPLAPLYHARCFANAPRPIAVVNLGGVGNVTWLGDSEITAGDTGPGCGVLDQWMQEKCGRPFDKNGEVALQGAVDQAWVRHVMEDAFFSRPFPKSADRFDFTKHWPAGMTAADGAASLCAVTAQAVADAIDRCGGAQQVWLTGGGARHPLIVRLLQERFSEVAPVERHGLRGDALEAECFGWLAVRWWRGLPTALPETTGARHATCGGALTLPFGHDPKV